MELQKVSTAIVLKTGDSLLNKKGEYPIKLRVTFDGTKKFYTVKGESATIDEFNNIMQHNSTGERKKKRTKYNSITKRADAVIEDLVSFSFVDFEREYVGVKGRKVTIQEFFEQKALELDADNKINSANLYRSAIKSLTQFDKKITFQKITTKFLKDYEKWMVEKQGKSYTTVGVYMRNLKCIINRAIEHRVTKDYPFGTTKDKYQIPVSNNTKKALSIDDIEKLVTYKPESPQEIQAQKYWLFSYLCSGMNMVDIANLKYKNIQGNNLKFIRQKTKDTTKVKTEIAAFLSLEAFEIIQQLGNLIKEPDNYIFPILTKGMDEKQKYDRVKQHIKNTNKYMKRIAQVIGIDVNITTYYARHSYSTVLKRSGASIEFIREQLGHQTSKVTQNYLDSFEDEQKEKYSANLLNFKK